VQRVAVLRIIQQALANVRQHAEAGQVVVTVRWPTTISRRA